jgi:hypothetical protein
MTDNGAAGNWHELLAFARAAGRRAAALRKRAEAAKRRSTRLRVEAQAAQRRLRRLRTDPGQ